MAPEDLEDLVVLRRQNLQQRHQGRQEDPVVLQQRSQVNKQLSLQQSLQGSQEAPAVQEVLVDQVALEALVDQVDLGALKHQDQVLPPKRQQPADLDVRQDRGVREVLVGPVDQADLVCQFVSQFLTRVLHYSFASVSLKMHTSYILVLLVSVSYCVKQKCTELVERLYKTRCKVETSQ